MPLCPVRGFVGPTSVHTGSDAFVHIVLKSPNPMATTFGFDSTRPDALLRPEQEGGDASTLLHSVLERQSFVGDSPGICR